MMLSLMGTGEVEEAPTPEREESAGGGRGGSSISWNVKELIFVRESVVSCYFFTRAFPFAESIQVDPSTL